MSEYTPDAEWTVREWMLYLRLPMTFDSPLTHPHSVVLQFRDGGIEPPGALLRFVGELRDKSLSNRQIRRRLRYGCPICFRRMTRTSREHLLCLRCDGRLHPAFQPPARKKRKRQQQQEQ